MGVLIWEDGSLDESERRSQQAITVSQLLQHSQERPLRAGSPSGDEIQPAPGRPEAGYVQTSTSRWEGAHRLGEVFGRAA